MPSVRTRTHRALRRWTPSASLLAVLLGIVPVTSVTPAYAEPVSDEAATPMARARFKEGVEFYDKGEYEQARASFLQAYALKKHPAVLLNLAWSSLKSGHTLEAERYFRQFLSEGKEITDKQRSDANDGLAQSRAKLGRIEISAPAGTDVTIDGERIGTTPISDQVTVEAGAHTIKFKGPDGAAETDSVTVLGGEKVVARFSKSAAVAVAPAPSAPLPAGETTPPASPPSSKSVDAVSASKPQTETSETPRSETHGGGLLAPPRNIVPVVVLGVVAAAGAATAIVAGVYFKNQAQSYADQSEQTIRASLPKGTNAPGHLSHATQRRLRSSVRDVFEQPESGERGRNGREHRDHRRRRGAPRGNHLLARRRQGR